MVFSPNVAPFYRDGELGNKDNLSSRAATYKALAFSAGWFGFFLDNECGCPTLNYARSLSKNILNNIGLRCRILPKIGFHESDELFYRR